MDITPRDITPYGIASTREEGGAEKNIIEEWACIHETIERLVCIEKVRGDGSGSSMGG